MSGNNNIMEHGTLLHDLILKRNIQEMGSAADAKLSWLRSQIIGQVADVHTPFGKRKLTYADHTASGRCLYYIEDYIIKNILPFYGISELLRNTHTSDSYVGDQTMKNVNEAAKYVKKCLGGTEDDALIFCGSGTTASIKRLQEVMGIAIPSVLKEKVVNSCLGSAERWVVFIGPYEHHSNLLSWRQSLAEVIEIGLDEEGLMDMDALKLQLQFYQNTGRPMLGSFSACSNVTGICSDTRSLSRLLHQFGAFVCFDFATSGPYVDIDMRSTAVDGYDAITLSPHKFLGGPGSPGILLMNKALYQLKYSPPSTCGGGTVDYVNSFDEKDTLYVSDIEEREHAGTPQIIQRVKAALAFQVKEYVGYKIISEKEHEYIDRALERLLKNQNIRVLGNTKVERQAILSFLVYTITSSPNVEHVNGKADGIMHLSSEISKKRDKPLNGNFVAKLLNDLFGIQARGGCACAGPYGHHLIGIDKPLSKEIRSAIEMGYIGVKSGWTRVSFPYYMSNEEFEFILSAIEFIAIYGQRFLPFYHFNWNTGSWKFNIDVIKETFLKENNCKLCTSFANNALKVVLQDKIKNLGTPEIIECKTKDDTRLSEYTYYMETAKHIGDMLPKFPSRGSVPNNINPNNIWFRV
ncbi:pyridoxal phosphate-dependent transferase [Tanacetum coccineum]